MLYAQSESEMTNEEYIRSTILQSSLERSTRTRVSAPILLNSANSQKACLSTINEPEESCGNLDESILSKEIEVITRYSKLTGNLEVMQYDLGLF